MPRRTPVKELQEETAVNSPLRRSSRISASSPVPTKVISRRNSASDTVTSTPKLTRGRRSSLNQEPEAADKNNDLKNTRTKSGSTNGTDGPDEEETVRPRTRRSSISKETAPITKKSTPRTRRSSSVDIEINAEQERKATPRRRNSLTQPEKEEVLKTNQESNEVTARKRTKSQADSKEEPNETVEKEDNITAQKKKTDFDLSIIDENSFNEEELTPRKKELIDNNVSINKGNKHEEVTVKEPNASPASTKVQKNVENIEEKVSPIKELEIEKIETFVTKPPDEQDFVAEKAKTEIKNNNNKILTIPAISVTDADSDTEDIKNSATKESNTSKVSESHEDSFNVQLSTSVVQTIEKDDIISPATNSVAEMAKTEFKNNNDKIFTPPAISATDVDSETQDIKADTSIKNVTKESNTSQVSEAHVSFSNSEDSFNLQLSTSLLQTIEKDDISSPAKKKESLSSENSRVILGEASQNVVEELKTDTSRPLDSDKIVPRPNITKEDLDSPTISDIKTDIATKDKGRDDFHSSSPSNDKENMSPMENNTEKITEPSPMEVDDGELLSPSTNKKKEHSSTLLQLQDIEKNLEVLSDAVDSFLNKDLIKHESIHEPTTSNEKDLTVLHNGDDISEHSTEHDATQELKETSLEKIEKQPLEEHKEAESPAKMEEQADNIINENIHNLGDELQIQKECDIVDNGSSNEDEKDQLDANEEEIDVGVEIIEISDHDSATKDKEDDVVFISKLDGDTTSDAISMVSLSDTEHPDKEILENGISQDEDVTEENVFELEDTDEPTMDNSKSSESEFKLDDPVVKESIKGLVIQENVIIKTSDSGNALNTSLPNSSVRKSLDKTSIVMQENVRATDKDKSLNERIHRVVDIFCAGIKTNADVSINVSLEYTGQNSETEDNDQLEISMSAATKSEEPPQPSQLKGSKRRKICHESSDDLSHEMENERSPSKMAKLDFSDEELDEINETIAISSSDDDDTYSSPETVISANTQNKLNTSVETKSLTALLVDKTMSDESGTDWEPSENISSDESDSEGSETQNLSSSEEIEEVDLPKKKLLKKKHQLCNISSFMSKSLMERPEINKQNREDKEKKSDKHPMKRDINMEQNESSSLEEELSAEETAVSRNEKLANLSSPLKGAKVKNVSQFSEQTEPETSSKTKNNKNTSFVSNIISNIVPETSEVKQQKKVNKKRNVIDPAAAAIPDKRAKTKNIENNFFRPSSALSKPTTKEIIIKPSTSAGPGWSIKKVKKI